MQSPCVFSSWSGACHPLAYQCESLTREAHLSFGCPDFLLGFHYVGEGNGSPLQLFLPEKFHGQRTLAGSVRGVEKSRMQLSTHTVGLDQ